VLISQSCSRLQVTTLAWRSALRWLALRSVFNSPAGMLAFHGNNFENSFAVLGMKNVSMQPFHQMIIRYSWR
jgi:hypothetical protein